VDSDLAIPVESRSASREVIFNPSDEASLVARAKADPTAFGPLFDAHYERILNYAYRSTLNRSAAEDITSNTFYKALRGLPRYRYRSPFTAWLYRIASNEIRRYWRDQSRTLKALAACSAIMKAHLERYKQKAFAVKCEEEHADELLTFGKIHELLKMLPERQRLAVTLRFIEELSYEAIGQVLGKRVGAVKVLVHRGVQRLKVLVERDVTFRAMRDSDL
jgi:RNA polymerase sigma-70 factor, ECF subfamily